MNHLDIVRKVFSSIEEKNTGAVAPYLTPDFVFSGPVPEPVDGKSWLGLHDVLNVAFPDFSFNLQDLKAVGDDVRAVVQITGTQKGSLDGSKMGMPVIPASGKSIRLPKEGLLLEFRGDLICEMKGEKVAGLQLCLHVILLQIKSYIIYIIILM